MREYRNRDWLYKHYIILQESTYTMARIAGCSDVAIGNWLRRFHIPVRGPDKRAPYRDRNWMHEHYVVLQESTPVMARKANCGHDTIWRWLRKFDIPIRTRQESTLLRDAREFQPYRNEDWLREHYVILQESITVMAQKADCGCGTIWSWLHKFNIPTRTPGEGVFLANRNYLDLSDKLSNLLEGELLGDGCITMSSSRSALYEHGSKYEEYPIWLSKIFADLGLEQTGKIYRRDGVSPKGNPYTAYSYISRSYPELVPIRQRWYPDGKKIVPKDLGLNPTMARQWYIGDGGLYSQAGGRPYIAFSTCTFDKPSIDHLLEELRGKGFKVNHWPSCNKIGMSVYSVKDFLNWIGPCPIDCYQYKWDYQDNRKSVKKSTRPIG